MEVEELFQEVMLRVLSSKDQFRGHASEEFLSWLRVIANHVVIDRLRELVREPKRTPLDEVIASLETGCEDLIAGRELVAVLLAGLSPFEASLLRARYEGGLSFLHIARLLGQSPEAVRQMHHRLLKRVRRGFSPEPD